MALSKIVIALIDRDGFDVSVEVPDRARAV